MQVIVKGRHMDLTDALKAHAEEKLGNSLMRIFDGPAAKIEIELGEVGDHKDNLNMECRVTVFMPKGKTINISEVADDMYKAIDNAHDRLLNQVKREQERRRGTHRKRVEAERARAQTARENLTTAPEHWEQEVEQYDDSQTA